MKYIELDIAHEDETIDEAIAALCSGLSIRAEVVKEATGAGWPIVQFVGDDMQIVRLLLRYTDDLEDFKYLLDGAEDA